MEKSYIIIAEGFEYDEETFVYAGEYEYCDEGINGYPMILVNGEWLDICDLSELPYVDIYER